MSAGNGSLKHIVVLMMENRSFDHMLGSLRAKNPKINGLTGMVALAQFETEHCIQHRTSVDPSSVAQLRDALTRASAMAA